MNSQPPRRQRGALPLSYFRTNKIGLSHHAGGRRVYCKWNGKLRVSRSVFLRVNLSALLVSDGNPGADHPSRGNPNDCRSKHQSQGMTSRRVTRGCPAPLCDSNLLLASLFLFYHSFKQTNTQIKLFLQVRQDLNPRGHCCRQIWSLLPSAAWILTYDEKLTSFVSSLCSG